MQGHCVLLAILLVIQITSGYEVERLKEGEATFPPPNTAIARRCLLPLLL